LAKRYLNTIKPEEAAERILRHCKRLTESEVIPVPDCIGRSTAQPLFASLSNPGFVCASMDGYATDFRKTLDADLTRPVRLLKAGDVFPVNTGDPVPSGCNAVVMKEDVAEETGFVTIRKPLAPWENVRLTGEDLKERDMVLPGRHRIGSLDIGLLLAAGVRDVPVIRKPRMLIIPTGKELVDPFRDPSPQPQAGQLVDFNSYTLKALAEELGFVVTCSEIARDRRMLQDIVQTRVDEYDVTCIIAGSSAGQEDFTASVIEDLGRLLFHGISIMPGKPALAGLVRSRPVIGIPGYPVSAVAAFRLLVEPLCERLTGYRPKRQTLRAFTGTKIPSRIGMEEIVRVSLVKRGRRYVAFPLPRGASIFSSLARADGLLRIPGPLEGHGEGAPVSCELLVEKAHLESRLNIIGSHDLCLDILRDMLKGEAADLDLISSHVGSENGIVAIRKGLSNLCTTHVLDDREGTYNIPILRRYLADMPWLLLHLVRRSQGLIVARGNPKKITGLKDLTRNDMTFVNRQVGSGTRILLDILLRQQGVDATRIQGYDREESSHTGVALFVREGIADAGLGIYAAGAIFGLDFIPLALEDYDLIVAGEFTKDRRFTILKRLIESEEFRQRLESFGGYDAGDSGTVKFVNAPHASSGDS
jgi:putative molybdopterin biosynthesis protein